MSINKAFHHRSLHNGPYDFDALVAKNPSLAAFIKSGPSGKKTINFADAKAVMAINQSLLLHHYNIENWSIPKGHLCPAVPGRADYIHYIADLLSEENQNKIPVGTKVKGLDIGTGTSCIYPFLGNSLYGWKFVASDIDSDTLNHVKVLLKSNPSLQKNIKTRFQKSAQNIFINLIKADEKFDFIICNPPFYGSAEEAMEHSELKVKNLNANKIKKGQTQSLIKKNQSSNFGGKNAELWCPGGELEFIKLMIKESVIYQKQVGWFTTLVADKVHLIELMATLKKLGTKNIRKIEMHHGKKITHLLAWRY
jgi:23S rRNA (adenine1618-N6)-methyltransferase